MSWWPRSAPDYQWPSVLLSARNAPRRWLLSGAFHLSRAAGRIVGALKKNPKTALFIRTDGIGDAVLAEPLLASFARRFGGCEIHLWAPGATCSLLRACPLIHHFLPVPRGFKEGNLAYFKSFRWRATLGYHLGRRRFQTVAYLVESPEPLGNWLLTSVRAKQRWYNPGDTENQFLAQRAKTTAAATLILPPRGESHESTRNTAMARQWAGDIQSRNPLVYLDDSARSDAAIQLNAWREVATRIGAVKIVGLMPTGSLTVKRYPVASCSAVVSRLWHDEHAICAMLGGPEDAASIAELVATLGDVPHLTLARPLDLPAMAALLKGLDGFVSTDTGLAHIALAQDVPTVVLRGGGHPDRFFPWPAPRRSVTLTHHMPCEGCGCRCHLKEAECLTKIDPAEVFTAISDLLKGRVRLPARIAG